MELKQLIEECKKHGIDITPLLPKPKILQFAVTACYERGFGPEYISLQSVSAKSIAEAQQMADNQAELYLTATTGFEKAVFIEAKIRPTI